MKKTSRPAQSVGIAAEARKTPPVPANMADTSQVAEQLLKLTLQANEITFAIADSERRTAELKGHLASVQKAFADIRPKVEGVLLPFNFTP